MQAIILAAGLGTRLGDLTVAEPKALIAVGGHALIDYALAFATAAGAEHRIVVSGFFHRELASRVGERDVDAVVVENSDFRKGNLLSLLAGRARLEPGGFLLMNVDHVYRPAIARLVVEVAERAREVTAFCDRDRTLGADDMKVRLDDSGRVAEMSKTLPRWDVGYVGMTWVPAARVAAHSDAAHHLLETAGESTHVEAVLVEMARRGEPPVIADISGHGWLEIDEPDERMRAEEVLRAESWWQLGNPS